jgi:hypothetical protein
MDLSPLDEHNLALLNQVLSPIFLSLSLSHAVFVYIRAIGHVTQVHPKGWKDPEPLDSYNIVVSGDIIRTNIHAISATASITASHVADR